MKKRQRLKLLSLLLCGMLLLGSVNPGGAYASVDGEDDDEAPVSDTDTSTASSSSGSSSSSGNSTVDKLQGQIDEISKQKDALEAERKQIQDRINETKSVKEKELAAKNALDSEIYLTRTEIELLEERIDLLEEQIEAKQEEIEAKQDEHDEKYDLFLQRVRAMYMYDEVTTLGLLLGADDFVDFLTRTEMVARIAEHDRNLMETLTNERTELENAQDELEQSKMLVEADKAETENKKSELDSKSHQLSVVLQDLNEMEAAFNADLEKNKAMAQAMEAEIKSLLEKIKWSTNPYAGGSMEWPVPGFYSITSGYGWRFNGSDYHTGVDISGSGVYGNQIVAANDGTVVLTNWSYTPGRGYGIYVVLDHGGGIGTLYGHCSNIVVSEGQTVKKGQKIAEVGSTGWSTGPHLHFEVRINGTHTNPMSYLQG